ncbi:MAG: UDP-N-acetylglucosamine 2-epimerase (non-hydrolyzing) [Thermoguttaceae bacterium]|jgi:UDP-N-acetylglucosamine 2-epimerase (non-hydrolysing)
MRITCVVGARPNFIKVTPILAYAAGLPDVRCRLVHTGQHYDERMSALFFTELKMPKPDSYLGVGSGNHAVQTASVMLKFDDELSAHQADLVLVVGDVNSTLACSLVAVKRHIPVAHVEAGLRSRDRRMPEEINRLLTDQISEYLFTTDRDAGRNLLSEGIPPERIHFVGNVMIDTLLRHRKHARRTGVLERLSLMPRGYAVCTIHRADNVDTVEAAGRTLNAIAILTDRLPVILPLHPRTRNRWSSFGLLDRLRRCRNLTITDPLGYLEFLALMDNAALVLTDSGGIQEETTILGISCLTFRDNTERPITVSEGTNQLVGLDLVRLATAIDEVLSGEIVEGRTPELWDGQTAARILHVLQNHDPRPSAPSVSSQDVSRAEASITRISGHFT